MTWDFPQISFYFHFIFHVCYHFYDSIDLFVFICYLSRMRRTSVYIQYFNQKFYDFLVNMQIHFTCHMKNIKSFFFNIVPIIIVSNQTIQKTRNKYTKTFPDFHTICLFITYTSDVKISTKNARNISIFCRCDKFCCVNCMRRIIHETVPWRKKKYKTTTYYPMIIVCRIRRKLRVPIRTR